METKRRAVLLAALALLMVAVESIRETTSVQLASELNVGFELLSSCAQQGSLNYEASELCQGRKPFQLYAAEGCSSYFWCSPELAACTTACPAGTVFNLACSCCQDSAAATAAGFDASTCSSTAQHAPQQQQQEVAAASNARRQVLEAQPEATQTAQPSSSSSSSDGDLMSQDEMRARARARARLMRRKRREAALRAAAAAAGGDSSISSSSGEAASTGASIDAVIASDSISSDMLPGGQLFPSRRRMARRSSRGGVWNSYGKRYSSGAFAGKNIVKEPAVRMPSSPAPAAAAAVVVESAAAQQQQPAAAAEAAVAEATRADAQQRPQPAGTSSSSSAELRQLLSDTPQAPAAPAAAADIPVAAHLGASRTIPVAGRRDVQMKRVQRIAAQATAAAAAAGDPAEVAATGDALEQAVHGGERHKFVLNPKLRPMDQKPAAKAIDPEDEQAAPFAAALAVKQQQHHAIKQPVRQHSRAAAAGQQALRRVPL